MKVIVTKEYYSLRAVLAAIEKLEITNHWSTNPAVKVKIDCESGNGITMLIEMSRPGYNSMGYHEGAEVCVFAIPIIERGSLYDNPSCVTYDIDPLVCDFDAVNIADQWAPEAYNSNGDDMTCEGYFPPDDEFWWGEVHHMLLKPIVDELEKGELEYFFSKEHPQDGSPGRFWLFTGDPDFVYNLDSPDPHYARENMLSTELP